ncbi:hypothetical protein PFISCL1PPCAC_20750, partial [Pristionchus fissidentatus]
SSVSSFSSPSSPMDAQFTALLLQNLYQQMVANGLLENFHQNGTFDPPSLPSLPSPPLPSLDSLSPPASASPDDAHNLSTSPFSFTPISRLSEEPSLPSAPSTPLSTCSKTSIDDSCSSKEVGAVCGSCSKGSCGVCSSGNADLLLWQYILEMLAAGDKRHLVEWTDEGNGEFRFVDADEFTALWNDKKGRKGVVKSDSMMRGLRFYYKKGILEKVKGANSKYRFRFINVDLLKKRAANRADQQFAIKSKLASSQV